MARIEARHDPCAPLGVAPSRRWALLAALAAPLGCRGGKQPATPQAPFTHESVLDTLRPAYPHVTLPADDLPRGVNPWFETVLSQTDGFLRQHLRGLP